MTEKKTAKQTSKSKQAKKKSKQEGMSRKKLWTILGSIFGGLVVVGLAIWGIITVVTENQPLEQEWAQTYYVYLDENKLNPELVDSDGEVRATADEYKVGFYDVEGANQPVMVVNYVDADTNYVTYYWINGEGKNNIGKAILYSPSEVELLYDIANKRSEYYIHYESDGHDYYKSLGDEILQTMNAEDPNYVNDAPSYSFSDDDVTKVTDKDGKEYSLSKFEETFIELDDDLDTTTLPINYEKNELKGALKNESYEYQVLEEVAKKHAEMVRQIVEDIEKRQNEIAAVQQENAELEAKKAAEEAARKAEEEARKGIKLENYTIAYGTYQLDVWDEIIVGETITINRDGTCIFAGKACTWKIGSRDFTQSPESTNVHQAIIFDTGNGYGSSYYAYGNNEFGDGDLNRYTLIR